MNDLIPSAIQSEEPAVVLNATQKSSSAKRTVAITMLVCAGLIAACLATTGLFFLKQLHDFKVQKKEYSKLIDDFMTSLSSGNYLEAQTMFSAKTKETATIEKLKAMNTGSDGWFCDHYQRVEVTSITHLTTANTNPNVPSGRYEQLRGRVYYDDGFSGQLEASLFKDKGGWKIHSININVPSQKIANYLKGKAF